MVFPKIFSTENEAEINIMIGEKEFRGQGIAVQSLKLMMYFANKMYKIQSFVAKIKDDNEISIN